jgi:hypothetical protein
MLARALHDFGLKTEIRGYLMPVRRPGGNGQAGHCMVVVLGHHPDDGDRLLVASGRGRGFA